MTRNEKSGVAIWVHAGINTGCKYRILKPNHPEIFIVVLRPWCQDEFLSLPFSEVISDSGALLARYTGLTGEIILFPLSSIKTERGPRTEDQVWPGTVLIPALWLTTVP